ncbi:hypothetical protein CLV35_3648 [Motilibacter peucedani]|uniref:Uncharacterized protein n=1 Tax=Motilibacter peucedani TaxID=598650 RepID=A0A420XKH8_9ACTN|nr:hypothetical protein [Motilibacter peucedani]RKS68520.1 hypothetical protein CLV35_3648 [Motilibacter peucedani]
MRVVALVAGEPERDAVLTGFADLGLPRLARLAPYSGTRVADCGAGTLVLVPTGGADVALAACAAGVALNRTLPDLVVAIDVTPDDDPVTVAQAGPDGEPLEGWLLEIATARLPQAQPAAQVTGPLGTGAHAAARVHSRRFLAVGAPLAQLGPVARALLARDLSVIA